MVDVTGNGAYFKQGEKMNYRKLFTALILIIAVSAMGAMEHKGFKQVTLEAGENLWVPFSNFDTNVEPSSLGGVSSTTYAPDWVGLSSQGDIGISFWYYSAKKTEDYIERVQPYSFGISGADTTFSLTGDLPVNFQDLGCHGAWVSSVEGGTVKIYWE